MNEKEGKTISRRALYDAIWTTPVTKVAERFAIPCNQIIKICKDNNIPFPPAGYHFLLENSFRVEIPPLPDSECEMIRLYSDKEAENENDEITVAAAVSVSEEKKIELVILPKKTPPKYDRNKLYKEVWKEPVTTVAKRYQVSDTALRKMCKKLDVPVPPVGYWAKVRAGKEVSKPDLPKLKKTRTNDKPKNGEPRTLHIGENALSFLIEKDRQKVIDVASRLRVAGPRARLHNDIAKEKQKCDEWLEEQKNSANRYERHIIDAPSWVSCVSPESYSRILHILDALFRAMLPFGISTAYGCAFRVNGEYVTYEVAEGNVLIPHELTSEEEKKLLQHKEGRRNATVWRKPNIPKWDTLWDGKLTLTIKDRYKFSDCKSYVLEDRIGEIMIAFYEASYVASLERLRMEENIRIKEEERRKAAEILTRYNQEVDYTAGLVNAANDYATACKIRAYVDAVKVSCCESSEWIEWATAKADWYDPTVQGEDPYFGKRRHTQDPENKEPKKRRPNW